MRSALPLCGTATPKEAGMQRKGWVCPLSRSWMAALSAYPSDAVIVQCQTTLHCKVVCAAASAGKHIFCEKVLAPTVKECLKIGKAVEQAGVKFMISLDALPYGVYALAKELINSGALGEIGTAVVRRVHGMGLRRRRRTASVLV